MSGFHIVLTQLCLPLIILPAFLARRPAVVKHKRHRISGMSPHPDRSGVIRKNQHSEVSACLLKRLYNRTYANLEKALVQIENNLQTLVSIDQIREEDIPSTMANIHGTSDLKTAVEHADFIIENVAEKEEIKKQIFAQIDQFCEEDVIFSSDTSTMNIYDFLDVSHPERLIITHFFNPAYVMPLVEIVRGPHTSDETVAVTKELLESCGKKTAVINKAIPGFILNRITLAVFREAAYIAGNGWASPEDIDKICVLQTYIDGECVYRKED